MRDVFNKVAAVGGLALASAGAMAQSTPPDFSSLTGAVDFTTVGAAILAVAALKVLPGVIAWGSRRVMSFIGR